jgi:hypothetical protein
MTIFNGETPLNITVSPLTLNFDSSIRETIIKICESSIYASVNFHDVCRDAIIISAVCADDVFANGKGIDAGFVLNPFHQPNFQATVSGLAPIGTKMDEVRDAVEKLRTGSAKPQEVNLVSYHSASSTVLQNITSKDFTKFLKDDVLEGVTRDPGITDIHELLDILRHNRIAPITFTIEKCYICGKLAVKIGNMPKPKLIYASQEVEHIDAMMRAYLDGNIPELTRLLAENKVSERIAILFGNLLEELSACKHCNGLKSDDLVMQHLVLASGRTFTVPDMASYIALLIRTFLSRSDFSAPRNLELMYAGGFDENIDGVTPSQFDYRILSTSAVSAEVILKTAKQYYIKLMSILRAELSAMSGTPILDKLTIALHRYVRSRLEDSLGYLIDLSAYLNVMHLDDLSELKRLGRYADVIITGSGKAVNEKTRGSVKTIAAAFAVPPAELPTLALDIGRILKRPFNFTSEDVDSLQGSNYRLVHDAACTIARQYDAKLDKISTRDKLPDGRKLKGVVIDTLLTHLNSGLFTGEICGKLTGTSSSASSSTLHRITAADIAVSNLLGAKVSLSNALKQIVIEAGTEGVALSKALISGNYDSIPGILSTIKQGAPLVQSVIKKFTNDKESLDTFTKQLERLGQEEASVAISGLRAIRTGKMEEEEEEVGKAAGILSSFLSSSSTSSREAHPWETSSSSSSGPAWGSSTSSSSAYPSQTKQSSMVVEEGPSSSSSSSARSWGGMRKTRKLRRTKTGKKNRKRKSKRVLRLK